MMSPLDVSPIQQLQSSVERLRLDDDFKISCNDLAAAKEASAVSLDEFLASLEHLAFYLRSQEASSIRNPKAWMLKKLRTDYFGPPADFVSWEVQQENEKLAAKKKRIENLRQVQRANFDADFELWRLEQTPAQLEAVKRELEPGFSFPLSSPMGQALLRGHFARSTGRTHLLQGEEDETSTPQRR